MCIKSHVGSLGRPFGRLRAGFARRIGLVEKIQAIDLHQKTVVHSPQTKVLEFFVAVLGGLEHLQDLSCAAHPIEKDRAVARAWGQPGWADYSGVSRCLSTLTESEARQIAAALEEISRPILNAEVMQALAQAGELCYDGDLTGRPISNTSTTYPGAAYGHMGDAVNFGYQAAMVNFHSPTYGRFWLSNTLHPRDVVSCTQAEALVLAAEAKSGMRPLRRTDLLAQRIQQLSSQHQTLEGQAAETRSQQQAMQAELATLPEQISEWQQKVEALKNAPPKRGRRPVRRIAKAHAKVQRLRRRQERLKEKLNRTLVHFGPDPVTTDLPGYRSTAPSRREGDRPGGSPHIGSSAL
ncbi:MAG: hypothetical protein KKC71_11255 [Chloroflexi bacterium]|nr:hypothetical protein [Chloroflexota bacterium]